MVCTTVSAVKYLYKYVYKGHDRVIVGFRRLNDNEAAHGTINEQVDEISNFLDARYISASESCWRIFHFPLHDQFPSIQRLTVLKGLCNGTRLICHHLTRSVIYAKIAIGDHAGQHVLIPRINLIPYDTTLPFIFKRPQFPVRLAFAMSINKAQGQTFKGNVGFYLPQSVFSHGQLYVALSRVCSMSSISVMVEKDLRPDKDGKYTRNVVRHEILR